MNAIYLDFAQCRCEYRTPIQPSTIAILGADRRSLGMDIETPYVACDGCKRIYQVENDKLESIPTPEGLTF